MAKDMMSNILILGILLVSIPVIGMLLYHMKEALVVLWRTSNFLEKIIILTMSIGVILFCVDLGGLLWKL